jgi:hypothetical protein
MGGIEVTASQRRWLLANALVTELTDRKYVDPELMALAAALAKECGFVIVECDYRAASRV